MVRPKQSLQDTRGTGFRVSKSHPDHNPTGIFHGRSASRIMCVRLNLRSSGQIPRKGGWKSNGKGLAKAQRTAVEQRSSYTLGPGILWLAIPRFGLELHWAMRQQHFLSDLVISTDSAAFVDASHPFPALPIRCVMVDVSHPESVGDAK